MPAKIASIFIAIGAPAQICAVGGCLSWPWHRQDLLMINNYSLIINLPLIPSLPDLVGQFVSNRQCFDVGTGQHPLIMRLRGAELLGVIWAGRGNSMPAGSNFDLALV